MGVHNPRDEFYKVLNGEKLHYFPRSIIINTPVVGMMKSVGVYWPQAHKDVKSMVKLIDASIKMTGFNTINVPFDMAIEAEALGCEIVWQNEINSIPQVKGSVFKDFGSINISKNILKTGRFPVVFEAIRLLRERYEDIPIVPFIEGPYTIAGLAVDVSKMYKVMLKDPGKASKVIDIFANLCISYGNEQLKCGADYVLMLDPNVSGLGGEQFKEILIPIYKKISREIKGKAILHICGDISRILKFIPESDFPAFSFDFPATNIETVKSVIGSKMKLVGAVATTSCLLEGTENDVFEQSIDCIKKGVDILAPSCCIPPEAPTKNLKAMVDAINYYNKNVYKVTF